MSDVALRKVNETGSKITFEYDKVAGAEGYRYFVNGSAVSRTFNPDDLEVTFGKVANATYRVVPLDVTERPDGYVWPAPVVPTDPPYWREDFTQQPASFWNWAYGNNNNAGFPNPGASLQSGTLRLGNPPNSPGGMGILSSMWTGGSQAHGTNGQEYWLATRFRFDSIFNGWFLEQHENFTGSRDIYSNALGITTARRLLIQRTGGELSAHPGSNGWQTADSQTLVPGQWYTLKEHVKWSPGNDGFFHVWLDGRHIPNSRENAPTLLTEGGRVDQVAFGLYSYPFTPQSGQTWVEYDYLVMGPTEASVNA